MLLSLVSIFVLFLWISTSKDDEEVHGKRSFLLCSPEIGHKWGFVVNLGIIASMLNASGDIVTSWNKFYEEKFVVTVISLVQYECPNMDMISKLHVVQM